MTAHNQGYIVTRRETLQVSVNEAIRVDSIDELPPEGALFVVLDFDEAGAYEALVKLRRTAHYQLTPVFYIGTPPKHHEQILDGRYEERSVDLAKAMHERFLLTRLNQSIHFDIEHLLASYLYLRNEFKVKCFLDYHFPAGFQYPLLELLIPYDEKHHYWYILQSMQTGNYIESGELISELQICPYCASGLLNFRNCCPNCHSVNIVTQSFIHCFTCGNIGPMSGFMRHDELVCTRCNTKLRHIGIDYDKPLEDKTCLDCQHWFFEPLVMAVCLYCSKLCDPQELQTRKLYAYQLTSRGEALARNLESTLVIELNQFLKTVDVSVFRMILKWQLQVAKRYKLVNFNLIGIKVLNQEQLILKHGLIKTEKLFAELFQRMRGLLRDTDLATIDDKTIIFFLPMTPPEHNQIVFERIRSFTDAQWSNGTHIELGVGGLSSDEILQHDITDDLLLTELHGRITV